MLPHLVWSPVTKISQAVANCYHAVANRDCPGVLANEAVESTRLMELSRNRPNGKASDESKKRLVGCPVDGGTFRG